MKSIPLVAALVFALAAFVIAPGSAGAYGLSAVGFRVGDVDPDGVGSTVAAGAHLEFEQSGTRVHLQPGLMFWSDEGVRDVNPNFDVMYHFAAPGRVSPFLGAGAGMHFYSIDLPGGGNDNHSDLGANLFGGVLVPTGNLRLVGEARYVATDRNQFLLTGGVTLPLGHH
jgi:hypothetical protein